MNKIKFKNPLNSKFAKNSTYLEMYPYYQHFSEECSFWEKQNFWFQDSLHHPKVYLPYETIIADAIKLALGQNNSRIFCVPTAYGIEQRIYEGKVYFSAITEQKSEIINKRLQIFTERSDYYFNNWNKIYKRWQVKVKKLIGTIDKLEFADLPEYENNQLFKNYDGTSLGYKLLTQHKAMEEHLFLAWQYHFEMLNVGYAGYLNFFEVCRKLFGNITDSEISSMVKGIDSILYKPKKIIWSLANYSKNLQLDQMILSAKSFLKLKSELLSSEKGKEWLRELESLKNPWFYMSKGSGFYHDDSCWHDDPDFVLKLIQDALKNENYAKHSITSLKQNRNKITAKYRKLLLDPKAKNDFDSSLKLARKVSIYLEDHNFYIENWFHSIFWQKTRDLAKIFTQHKFLKNIEDFYYLNRWEVGQALYELASSWATGASPRGKEYWPQKISERRSLANVLSKQKIEPTLGALTDQINEPITNILFGITKETVSMWDNKQKNNSSLTGICASKGEAQTRAIIINDPLEITNIDSKEKLVLVCKTFPPTWEIHISRFAGIITEIGGVMSHAAIICREYNIPAVVSVQNAMTTIKNNDLINLDANNGTVKIMR